jgi:uncharacterized damage-inducible protein DinB
MDEQTLFTNHWTREAETTHKVLDRIPEGSTYRPDPRSRTAQEIAWQLVCMAWSFLFDIVHHRGQISTYLRPMGSTVPQIYGPSGDEP